MHITDVDSNPGTSEFEKIDSAKLQGMAPAEQADIVNFFAYPDQDEDGLSDEAETQLGSNPGDKDTDADGLLDKFEYTYGFNLLSNPGDGEGQGDSDADYLTNLDEQTHGTNPTDPDSDDDGLLDGDEVHVYNSNPLNKDTDGDGGEDGEEVLTGTRPDLVDRGYQYTVLSDDPLAYCTLDDPASITAASDKTGRYLCTYSNVGRSYSALAQQSLYSASFDGTAAKVSIGNFPSQTAFTLSAWVKPTNLTGTRTIIGRNRASGSIGAYGLRVSSSGNSRASFYLYSDTGSFGVSGTTVLETGKTYHVVGTFDQGTGTARLYVNGVMEGEAKSSTFTVAEQTGALLIGSGWYYNNSSYYMAGQIDEVAVFDRALSESDIASHYATGLLE
jgi:hypothetical protein